MSVLIFGGTTEGRELAQILSEKNIPATVSVATPLGAEELAGLSGITVLVGRKDTEEIIALLEQCSCCVDATHPYAKEISQNIETACARTQTPWKRLLRQKGGSFQGVQVASAQEAAQFLNNTEGNILLATGAKELAAFGALEKTRLYPRVLPVQESLAQCQQLQIPTRNILALYGPFSQELNEAILRQYHIQWMVTKDGGAAGGFAEKVAAARQTGVELVVIGRPAETGESLEQIVAWLEQGRK